MSIVGKLAKSVREFKKYAILWKTKIWNPGYNKIECNIFLQAGSFSYIFFASKNKFFIPLNIKNHLI